MVKYDFEEAPIPNEQRKLIINGKRYHMATANVCGQCAAPDRFMYVKVRIPDGDIVLECPVCDQSITVKPSMVKLNLNT